MNQVTTNYNLYLIIEECRSEGNESSEWDNSGVLNESIIVSQAFHESSENISCHFEEAIEDVIILSVSINLIKCIFESSSDGTHESTHGVSIQEIPNMEHLKQAQDENLEHEDNDRPFEDSNGNLTEPLVLHNLLSMACFDRKLFFQEYN